MLCDDIKSDKYAFLSFIRFKDPFAKDRLLEIKIEF